MVIDMVLAILRKAQEKWLKVYGLD
jgi:hypothetical protein